MTPLQIAAVVTGSAVAGTAAIVGAIVGIVALGGWAGVALALVLVVVAMFLVIWWAESNRA